MMDLPRVGAKIRVTRTHESGSTAVYEFVVTGHGEDWTGEHEVYGDGLARMSLLSDFGWTVTVEELEPPKPTLPPEPPIGSVIRLTSSRTTNMGHLFEHYEEAWFLAEDTSNVAYTWSALHEMGTVTPLVAVPDLAELVRLIKAYRKLCHHLERCTGDVETCGTDYCSTMTALLTKYPSEVAS